MRACTGGCASVIMAPVGIRLNTAGRPRPIRIIPGPIINPPQEAAACRGVLAPSGRAGGAGKGGNSACRNTHTHNLPAGAGAKFQRRVAAVVAQGSALVLVQAVTVVLLAICTAVVETAVDETCAAVRFGR